MATSALVRIRRLAFRPHRGISLHGRRRVGYTKQMNHRVKWADARFPGAVPPVINTLREWGASLPLLLPDTKLRQPLDLLFSTVRLYKDETTSSSFATTLKN